MALFSECTQSCVHMVLDIAGIVRDRDVTPITEGQQVMIRR